MKSIALYLGMVLIVTGCASSPKPRPSPPRHQKPQFTQTGTVSIKTAPATRVAPVATVDNLLMSTGNRSLPPPESKLITITVELHLRVVDPIVTMNDIIAVTGAFDGLVVTASAAQSEIRVPVDLADTVAAELSKLGRVIFRKLSNHNITDHYRNLQLSLENIELTRQRFLQLLDEAGTVEEAIKVERELDRVKNQISRNRNEITSQERDLKMARIVITLRGGRDVKPGPVGYVLYRVYQGVAWLFAHH